MEPEDLFLLEQGPASFSLTIMMLIKSESEPPPETLVFKKWREQFHVVYVSDKLWTSDKMLLEEKEKSGFLQPVLTTLGIESLKNVASSCCYVLQRDWIRMVDHVVGSDELQKWKGRTDSAFSTEQNKGCLLDGRDAQLRPLRLGSLLGWFWFHLWFMGPPCQHHHWTRQREKDWMSE